MKQITFQNKKIFYRAEGKGKPVMLLHGFAEDGNIWNYQFKKLKEKFFVIVPDLPGSGSSEMLEGKILIEDYADVVKAIANSSLKSPKFARLLFRMIQYYKPKNILELGTSFGITTSYLANGNRSSTIYTCEGADQIAAIAQQNFDQLGIKNITLLKGDFAQTLPNLFAVVKQFDFAFVDGNHRKEPTLSYFQQLMAHSTHKAILVFDDIHWSSEMEAAWSLIQNDPSVTLTIDLFFIGIVFINDDIKVKQHFTIAC